MTRHAQALVDAFNDLAQVGARVRYWPGLRTGADAGTISTTRSPAWLLGGHTAVVAVEGHPGGVALTHVQLAPDLTSLLAWPDLCHAGVSRAGEYQPCDKPAVGVLIGAEGEPPYPVCVRHSRAGRMVGLRELLTWPGTSPAPTQQSSPASAGTP